MKKTGIKSTPAQKPEAAPEAVAKNVPAQKPELETKAAPEMTAETVLLELPLGEVGGGEYLSTHVEARLRTREQRLAMKRLLRGLQKAGAKTKDGRPVQRLGEAIRWLLEQVAAK